MSTPLGDEIDRLREELDITDKLLAARERVLDAIPPCPVHGSQCIPHALEWIEAHKGLSTPPGRGGGTAYLSGRTTLPTDAATPAQACRHDSQESEQ